MSISARQAIKGEKSEGPKSAPISRDSAWHALFDGLPTGVFIIDESGHILLVNEAFRELATHLDPFQQMEGGQFLQALSNTSMETEDLVPGTREWAEVTAVAILSALEQTATSEVYINGPENSQSAGMYLNVTTRTTDFNGTACNVVTVEDLTESKFRQNLESIFLHDIMNTAGVIRGMTILASTSDGSDIFDDPEFRDAMMCASETMVDEISSHSQLLHAEMGDIEVFPKRIDPSEFLHEMIQVYSRHKVAIERSIQLAPPPPDSAGRMTLMSSSSLVGRIVGNMIKNGLEHTEESGSVTIGWFPKKEFLVFWVHNDGFIPPWVQRQIFRRSFSTKGPGRGQGTYSMKLLAERYIYGKVWFTSDAATGTTFYLQVPLEWRGPTECG